MSFPNKKVPNAEQNEDPKEEALETPQQEQAEGGMPVQPKKKKKAGSLDDLRKMHKEMVAMAKKGKK